MNVIFFVLRNWITRHDDDRDKDGDFHDETDYPADGRWKERTNSRRRQLLVQKSSHPAIPKIISISSSNPFEIHFHSPLLSSRLNSWRWFALNPKFQRKVKHGDSIKFRDLRDWDMNRLPDDDLLVDRYLDGNWVWSRHVDDLMNRDWVGFGNLDWVWGRIRFGERNTLVDRNWMVLDHWDRDTNRLRDRNGNRLRDWDRLGDRNDLLDGLVNGYLNWNVDGMRHRDDLWDRNDLWNMDNLGDWHRFGDMDRLMDHFNYRGFIMAISTTISSRGCGHCDQGQKAWRNSG